MRTAQTNSKTKEKLLDAAQDLMMERGFSATSVEDICRKAQLTKGSFFHYFESKEDLGKAVLKRFCDDSQKKREGCCCPDKESDPLKRIAGYLDDFSQMTKGKRSIKGCLLGAFSQELSDTSPQIQSMCAKAFEEWIGNLEDDLAEAKRKYIPWAKIDTKSLAEHLVAVLEGAQIIARAKKENKVVGRSVNHLKKYLETVFNHKIT